MLKIIFSAIAELMYHSCKKGNFQLCGIKKRGFSAENPLFSAPERRTLVLGI
jgi:hypothetical protein